MVDDIEEMVNDISPINNENIRQNRSSGNVSLEQIHAILMKIPSK